MSVRLFTRRTNVVGCGPVEEVGEVPWLSWQLLRQWLGRKSHLLLLSVPPHALLSPATVQWVVVEMRIMLPGGFQPPALCPPQLPKDLARGGLPFVDLENGFSSLQPRGLETACGRVGCRGHSLIGWGSGGRKRCLQSSSGWRKHQIVTSKNESPKHHAI